MKLDEIQKEWAADSEVDRLNFSKETTKSASLHSKYWKYLSHERLLLAKLTEDLKQLKHDKFWWLIHGDDETTIAKGWRLPPRGCIVVKEEARGYVERDQDVIDLTLRVAMQTEKVDFLKDIIYAIRMRSYDIKNYIEWSKFQAGS